MGLSAHRLIGFLNMVRILIFGSIASVAILGSFFAGIKMLFTGTATEFEPILAPVVRAEFEFSILEQGTVESSKSAEIVSEVGTSRWEGVPLLRIEKEGTYLKEGDIVAELDSASIDLSLKTSEIAVNSADSKLATEKSAFESAKEEKLEFLDKRGVFFRDKTKAENAIATAATKVLQAEEYLKSSKKLQAKGYITQKQLEQDNNTLIESRKALDLARIELELLERGKKRKLIEFDAKIEAARVAVENAKTTLDINKKELENYQKMKENCTIRVPKGVEGKIVYPDRWDHYTDKKVVMEPGTKISAKQSVALIPDPKYMQVNGLVSESRIVHVKKGQTVEITLDARSDKPLRGKVANVSQFVQKDRWQSSGVNKYKVVVSIDDPPEYIRSGMNASIRIVIEKKASAVQIPVQAMMEVDDEIWCFVKNNDNYEKRKIKIGTISSDTVCVESGLEEGEEVVMNPRAFERGNRSDSERQTDGEKSDSENNT